jgi:hypothetical protein
MPKDLFETDLVQGAKDYLRAFAESSDRPPIEKETQAYLQSLLEKFEQEQATAEGGSRPPDRTPERSKHETAGETKRQRKRRLRMLFAAFNESVEGRRLRFRIELPAGRDRLSVTAQHPWVKRLFEPFFTKPVRIWVASHVKRHPALQRGWYHGERDRIEYESQKGWITRGDAALALAFTRFLERNAVDTETNVDPRESTANSDVHQIIIGADAENFGLYALEFPLRFRAMKGEVLDTVTDRPFVDSPVFIHAVIARRQDDEGRMVLHVSSRARHASLCLARTLTSDDGIRELLKDLAIVRGVSALADPANFPFAFELVIRLGLSVLAHNTKADAVYAVTSQVIAYYDCRTGEGHILPTA